MDFNPYLNVIKEQTCRALINLENALDCVSNDECWFFEFDENPIWKHVYHTLHSLDQWFINPNIYTEPDFHEHDLNNLFVAVSTNKNLSCEDMKHYFRNIKTKIEKYLESLSDNDLLQRPEKCSSDRLSLIIGQHRHLHCHIGTLIAISVIKNGVWPKIIGMDISL
ncbi:MAG: hypothetical protein LBG29_09055 [Synergistaceae bacterium]|jgi:hypothetical protein|nr:hypothetical protein [Synergistaceae bacterium]